jgi:hypothetical protein
MGLRDAIHRLLRPAEKAVDEAGYGVIRAVQHAEEAIDEATHGRYTEATDAIDEEVDELGERLHLDGDANEEQRPV